jgi:hypothetical protein
LNPERAHEEYERSTSVISVVSISSAIVKVGVLTFRDVEFKSVPPVGLLSSQIIFLGVSKVYEDGCRWGEEEGP